MEFLVVALIAVVVFVAILVIGGWFLQLGARIAGIEERSLGKCIWAVVAGGLVSSLVSGLLQFLPLGGIVGPIVGLAAYAWVVMSILHTTYGKAVLACVIVWVIQFALVFGAALLVMSMGLISSP